MWCLLTARAPPVPDTHASASGGVQQAARCPMGRQQQRRPQRRRATASAAAAGAAATGRTAVPVSFILGGEEITVEAMPGQNFWEVAKDAGADITLGCSQGSCGICEVEVRKYSGGSAEPSTSVVRACIAGIPPGYARLEVHEVPDDDIWGVDGYDT